MVSARMEDVSFFLINALYEGFMSFKTLSSKLFVSVVALASMQGCSDKADSSVQVASADCWIDSVNDNAGSTVKVNVDLFSVRGWAADSSTGTAPKEMAVNITDSKGNKVVFKTDKRISRIDVATAKKQPKYEMSGFDIKVDGSSLPVGEHSLSLVMYRNDATVTCSTPTKLLISKR
jgi:hypothetical protein